MPHPACVTYLSRYVPPVNEIRTLRVRTGLTQSALAAAAGTSQPTIAAYEADRKSPTLDTVRRLAGSVGLEARVEFYPPLTREDRRSLFLHEAIARRLMEDPSPVVARSRANLKRMSAAHAGARQLLREWAVLLDRTVDDLVPVLLDASPRGRELRQVTPFAGVLSAAERAEVYRAFARREMRPK